MRGKVVELLRHHCHCHCRQYQGPTTTTPDTNTSPCERNPFRYAPPRPNAAPRNTRVVWTGTLEAGTRRCSKHGARTRGPDASRCPRRKQLCARQREADNTLLSHRQGSSYKRSFWTSDGFVWPTWLNACSKRDCFAAGILVAVDFLGGMVQLGQHSDTRRVSQRELGYLVDGTTQSL